MKLRKAWAVCEWLSPKGESRMGAARTVRGQAPLYRRGNRAKRRLGAKLGGEVSLVLLFIIPTFLHAQKNDTLTPLRDFINISSGYKQMPLYLELEMKNSTNFITGEDDTSDVNGKFYLGNENSYVRFGEFEQVVNDSLALLVSDELQQMILYTDAAPVVKKMKSMMGITFPDSSIRKLAGKYISSVKELSKQSAMIELHTRAVLYGTTLPKETIELQYDVLKKMPQQVTTLTRSLLRLDSMQYSQLQNEHDVTDSSLQLLTIEGSYFLIKKQFTMYLYKKIEPASATVKVPVLITDRIMKNEEGEYVPVKKYESYRLTQNE